MELKDLPKPISRKDIYKYAICNGLIDNLPKPLSRQDFYLMALINGDTEDLPKPISRLDIIMYNCIMGTMENLPKPISRADYYWTAICTGLKQNIPTPVSRSDYYDYYLALHSAFREYLEYKGETIQATCGREAYIRDLKLEGKTYKNLFNGSLAYGASSVLYDLEPNTDYTIKLTKVGDDGQINIGIYKTDGTSKHKSIVSKSSPAGEYCYLLNDSALKYITVYKVAGSGDATIGDVFIIEGDYTNTEVGYINNIESCGSKEGKINLSINSNIIEIPMELKGLPNGVKDTIEKINGIWSYVKKVDSIVLNSDNCNIANINTTYRTDINLINCYIENAINKDTIIDDYIIDKTEIVPIANRNINNVDKVCVILNRSTTSLGAIIQYLLPKDIDTVDKAKEYISAKNITVYYQLAEPVITPLSQELQDKLDSLQVAKGSNTITTNNNVKANIECNLPV